MTDNRTTELLPCPFCGCTSIDEYEGDFGNGVYCMGCGVMMGEQLHRDFYAYERMRIEQAIEAWNTRTPEQTVAATLGSERDEIYNAGFDNGVKACLHILDGYLDYPHSAVENISKWVDEQWKECES